MSKMIVYTTVHPEFIPGELETGRDEIGSRPLELD